MIIGNWEVSRKPRSTELKGWPGATSPVPLLDSLSDAQLNELNHLLDFHCFTVDSQGRRFGLPAGGKKRSQPQVIPDRRVVLLDELVDLKDKTVLEVGCFEGVHTIALSQRAKAVLALDSRVENVVKTIVRCAFYDVHPRVLTYDLENLSLPLPEWLDVDVAYHSGVLYHLSDPVQHLLCLAKGVKHSLLLDTHVARPEQLDSQYVSNGKTWRYYKFKESGYRAVFAGMKDHAKWITMQDIVSILEESGFSSIRKLEKRKEKNGLRVCLFATRSRRG